MVHPAKYQIYKISPRTLDVLFISSIPASVGATSSHIQHSAAPCHCCLRDPTLGRVSRNSNTPPLIRSRRHAKLIHAGLSPSPLAVHPPSQRHPYACPRAPRSIGNGSDRLLHAQSPEHLHSARYGRLCSRSRAPSFGPTPQKWPPTPRIAISHM